MTTGSASRDAVHGSIRLRRLGKEMAWVCLGQSVAVLGGIVGVRWLTELLLPATFGQLALGMTVAALVQQVVLAPPAQAALRFFWSSTETQNLGVFLSALKKMVWRCI